MPGGINEFKSSFRGDVARVNKFDVNVNIPLVLIPYISGARILNLRCENAQLPGRTFATTEQKTYGPIEKYPYMTTYNDIDLTFIVDDDMQQKVLFDAWLNFINPSYNNHIRYKQEYATILTVNQYDVMNKLSYSVSLYDAYPISVNQMDLDWNGDGYHKLGVTFAYTYWKNNSLQAAGMELVDAGIAAVSSIINGSSVNPLPVPDLSATDAGLFPGESFVNTPGGPITGAANEDVGGGTIWSTGASA
jgi:hypothetical protein